MANPPPFDKHRNFLALQRAFGNRIVRRWVKVRRQTVQPVPLLQRDPPPPDTATRPGRARSEAITRDIARFRTSSMDGYIIAVQALEAAFPGNNPRQTLAMLRQVYYGRPWSSSPTEQWSDVLPESPEMADPRSGGQPGLFYALQQSQVVDGVDVGHVLAGLEAQLNPTRQVELEIPGPNHIVRMPNTEFATWGGDLGSAAGQAQADHDYNPPADRDEDYFRNQVSDADLEGDIDAFSIGRGAEREGGLAAMLTGGGMPGSATPVSAILRSYYRSPSTTLGTAHTRRYQEFIAGIGGQVSGCSITNRPAIIMPIAQRVSTFARVWYARECRDASLPGVGHAGAARILTLPGEDLLRNLLIKSRIMVDLFFDWLEARL